MIPFTVAFHHATAHGVVTAVHIPDSPDPVPEGILGRLPREEQDFARESRGYRQVQFVGGRIALRLACEQLGAKPGALLPNDRGAAILPAGITGSISHKSTLAIAMAARAHQGILGIDLEDHGPPRLGIARKVLTPNELALIEQIPEQRRWIAVLLRFSMKEAIYKALDPYVRRYVGFHEAEVEPDLHGAAQVRLHLAQGEGPFIVDARYEWLFGRVLTSARIRPSTHDTLPQSTGTP